MKNEVLYLKKNILKKLKNWVTCAQHFNRNRFLFEKNRLLPVPLHENLFMLNLFAEWHLNSAGKCFSCQVDELLCGEECKSILYDRLWMCNGVCQSWNLPCNGTCLADEKILSLDDKEWNHPDSFWKCPYEDKCISPFQLCNQADTDKEDSDNVNCENVINKSRLLCDNPDKFDVILNCTKQNRIQCPGNKTQQCIYGEHICNGIIDCIDRYSIL
jgi:hypothetical protein